MPGGSPAAAQVMQLLTRPEVWNALLSMVMGETGRKTIAVGPGTPVPVSAFANLLAVRANQAAEQYNAGTYPHGEGPQYWEAIGDPAVDEHRAEALEALLQDTAPRQRRPYAGRRESQSYEEYAWELEDQWELEEQYYYKLIELAELETGYAP
jgi:hypothetical protein